MTASSTPHCVACDRTSAQVPLLQLDYRDGKFWICPQHLPMLIHDPRTLVGKLPGAEGMTPADHKD
jgi:hypothetical protein